MNINQELKKMMILSAVVLVSGLGGSVYGGEDLLPPPTKPGSESTPVEKTVPDEQKVPESSLNTKDELSLNLEQQPAQAVPLQDVPMQELPLENDPLMETPLEQQQVEEGVNSVQQPMHEAPLPDEGLRQMSTPLENAPVEDIPTGEFPAD